MGFVADAVSDVGSAIGHQFGFGGGANQFRATAPVNTFHAEGPGPAIGSTASAIYNPFQAQQAELQNTNYGGALGSAMGPQGQSGVAQQQGSFADALRAQMAGNGPSVAQEQLRQGLQQNQQMAAGAIGSQRGINPAMAGRMIGQNQANAGQQFAGQSALLRSQEQLNAQGLLGQTLAAQRGQDIAQQQAQTGLIGTLGGLQQGQNALGLQNFQGMQGLNQQTAAQNAQLGTGMAGLNAQLNQQTDAQRAALGMQAQGMNAATAAGNQQANLDAQRINAGVSGQNANISSNVWGGLLNGGAAAMGKMFSAGGEVPSNLALDDPMSYIGLHSGKGPDMGGFSKLGAAAGKGLGDSVASFDAGGAVPGKADKPGDSAANDDVPIMASPGEIVLPRSIAQAEDAPERAAEFVRAIRRKKEKEQGPQGYGRVLALERRIEKLEGKKR